MTTHAYKRCHHCLTRYTFQGSGFGAPKYNDPDHCPDCKEVIVDALATVPRRFEKVLVPTGERDAVELEALQEADHLNPNLLTPHQTRVLKSRGGLLTEPLPDGALPIYDKDPDAVAFVTGDIPALRPRRVEVGLIDQEDPSNKDKRGRVQVEGKMFHWNYWSKDPEGTAEVRVEMERDLSTGEEVPWLNFR
jgi:hypothetical protein